MNKDGFKLVIGKPIQAIDCTVSFRGIEYGEALCNELDECLGNQGGFIATGREGQLMARKRSSG